MQAADLAPTEAVVRQDAGHVNVDLRGLGRAAGQATSEADKGSTLEELMAQFLRTDPVYAEQFSDVYLWQDWPGRGRKHDTGIDLVAVDRLTGANVAIQSKFYAPGSTIGKNDIDSFLSASGKEGFAQPPPGRRGGAQVRSSPLGSSGQQPDACVEALLDALVAAVAGDLEGLEVLEGQVA